MKLIYLEWADAHVIAGWSNAEETKDWCKNADWYIKTAGWLVEETKEHIVIAEDWKVGDDYTEEQFCNLHKIPKTWVKNRKNLKWRKK